MIALLEVEDPGFIREAARRGVFAYVANGQADEPESALDIVLERFAEFRNLEGAFGRRAITERAEGILIDATESTSSAPSSSCARSLETRGASWSTSLRPWWRATSSCPRTHGRTRASGGRPARRLDRIAVTDRLAELAALEQQPAACAFGRDHARAGEQGLEQGGPENGIRNDELRGHTGDIDTSREI